MDIIFSQNFPNPMRLKNVIIITNNKYIYNNNISTSKNIKEYKRIYKDIKFPKNLYVISAT